MLLVEEQRTRIAAKLTPSLHRGCPACGQMKLNVSDVLTSMREFDGSKMPLNLGPHKAIAMVLILCDNCGYVMPFIAQQAGLRPDELTGVETTPAIT